MPRTKLNRGGNAKRARDHGTELDDLLRDFDVDFDTSIQNMRRLHAKNLDDVESIIQGFKLDLGESILQLTMGELKKMKSLKEVSNDKTVHDLNVTVKDTLRRVDEGYLTEEASNKSRLTSDSESGVSTKSAKISTIGTLKTQKSRRRSKSASSVPASAQATPGPRAMMSQLKMRTPMTKHLADPSSHASRTKFRTPLTQPAPAKRAASADRFTSIVPKVNPATPISLLRHARVGEMAFSVTGSPIVPSGIVETTANVNIPVANGVLSIRPQNLDPAQLDTSLMNKFDNGTIEHLRQLKNNLDLMMSKFDQRRHH